MTLSAHNKPACDTPRGGRSALVVLVVGCGGGGGWRASVVSDLADPAARPVTIELADGTNGTQAVLAVLAQAKAREVSAISRFEIQIGRCTREIAVAPAAVAPMLDQIADRITTRAQETRFTCKKLVEQVITSSGGGPFQQAGLGDAQMVERDECRLVPVERTVTRYRFELERRFVPPDWDEVARWTSTTLRYGPPRCGTESKTEIRARFHTAAKPAAVVAAPPPPDVRGLVAKAREAAAAKRPGQATDFAEQALAALGDGEVDDALADSIAAAHFFAIEMTVDVFLHRESPVQIDDAWARELGADIDRIAKRYERIKDLVRLPVVGPWLRRGAGRLAELHLHAAGLLERGGQTRAADAERAKAKALADQATR